MNRSQIFAVVFQRLIQDFETMENSLPSLKGRDDFDQIAELMNGLRSRFQKFGALLEQGIEEERAPGLFGGMGIDIQKTRLAIRKLTGMKRWAANKIR